MLELVSNSKQDQQGVISASFDARSTSQLPAPAILWAFDRSRTSSVQVGFLDYDRGYFDIESGWVEADQIRSYRIKCWCILKKSSLSQHNNVMRLWSLHPKYLDSKGLVAVWREGLLAQKVLKGDTKGYISHPQLIRFRESGNPLGAIATYLRHVAVEAEARGYTFDRSKIVNKRLHSMIIVTNKQIAYEYKHLLAKLSTRDPVFCRRLRQSRKIEPHPLFREVPGDIACWERT